MKYKFIQKFSIANAIILMASNILPFMQYVTFGESKTKDSMGSINMEDDGITIGFDETQTQKTTYSDELEIKTTEDEIQGADVYVSQASTFGVFIPKTIILDGKVNENGINKANYIVNVSTNSNISGQEKIKVIPDTQFYLSQLGKNDIKATILQDKIEWAYNELTMVGNGEISTNEMSAGSWKGSFNFNILLEDNSSFIKVDAYDENGVNLKATSKEIKGEEKEQLLNALEESTLINSKNEVDLLIDVKSNDFENMANTTFDVSSIANENDKVVILHFDETRQEWEYISTEIVDSEGKITTNMSSFSPVAFVKVDSDGKFENIGLEPGLYDKNNVMLCSWNNSGINITKDYTSSNYKTEKTSVYYVITNKYPTTTKIIMPNDITKIGDYGFSQCASLTNIKLSQNLRTIGASSITCKNLKNIIVPENVTTIGNYAFGGCSSLKSLKLGENITNVSNNSFQGCSGDLTLNFNIPTVTSANQSIFYNSLFTSITFENKVTSIGDYAFSHCDTIESITFGENITSIGNNAFQYNNGLVNLNIPDNITTIGNETFKYCHKLKNLKLGNGIESIGKQAFGGCRDLINLDLGNNISIVSEYMFSGCDSLENLIIPNNIVKIEKNAFGSCKNLTNIVFGNNLERIEDSAFSNCTNLKEIVIPKNITYIDEYAFISCSNLTRINVEENNPIYDSRENCNAIIETSKNRLILGCKNTLIPNSITTIGGKSFYGRENLTSIYIPSSINKIEVTAFVNCINLSNIIVDEKNTTFDSRNNCNAIIKTSDNTLVIGCQNTIIPNGITSIGPQAFHGCKNLTTISLPNSITKIGTKAFASSGLVNILLPQDLTYIGDTAFYDCRNLTNITIPDKVIAIYSTTFRLCTNLTEVTIGTSVERIGVWAFYQCNSLTKVVFKDTTTWYIGDTYDKATTRVYVSNSTTNVKHVTETYYYDNWWKK